MLIFKTRYARDTALTWAAYNGHLETVRALIDARADVNLPNHRGHTALKLATRWGHTEIEALIEESGAKTKTSLWRKLKRSITMR